MLSVSRLVIKSAILPVLVFLAGSYSGAFAAEKNKKSSLMLSIFWKSNQGNVPDPRNDIAWKGIRRIGAGLEYDRLIWRSLFIAFSFGYIDNHSKYTNKFIENNHNFTYRYHSYYRLKKAIIGLKWSIKIHRGAIYFASGIGFSKANFAFSEHDLSQGYPGHENLGLMGGLNGNELCAINETSIGMKFQLQSHFLFNFIFAEFGYAQRLRGIQGQMNGYVLELPMLFLGPPSGFTSGLLLRAGIGVGF